MSGVFLVTLALALLLAWSGAGALAALARAFPPMRTTRPSTRLRAALVVAPGVLGLVLLLLVLVPSPLAACHCIAHGDGHPHLCIRHPGLARPLVDLAAPVALAWLIFAAVRVSRVVRDLAKAERWASELRALPAELVDGVEVRFVNDLGLGAFTVGLWKPLVVVDHHLWQGLGPVERLAVLHHEHAHAARGDALTQACLRLISAVLPWSVANGAWLRTWRSATELVCDRHAALKLHDCASVANALVSVERLRASRFDHEFAPVLGVAAGGDLALRVRALLDESPSQPPRLRSDLYPLALGLVAAAALLLVWPSAFVHHAAESFLGLLTHH